MSDVTQQGESTTLTNGLSTCLLVLTSILWGCTNPFIKRYSTGVERIKSNSFSGKTFNEVVFLFTNWKFAAVFVLNQSGSLLYFLALSISDLSIASPLTNSLTFVITTLCGRLLGETIASVKSYVGMCLVMVGVCLCMLSKL